MIIEHEGNFYNLYLSDKTGVYYSLSLRDLVVDFGVDLEKVSCLVYHCGSRSIVCMLTSQTPLTLPD